jgi:hypothetical protein
VHHRAVHRGTLIIEGRASTGFRFLHADGTTYGGIVDPARTEASELAFVALRQLGFQETPIRQALRDARALLDAGTEPHVGVLVHQALRLLTPARIAAPGLTQPCEVREERGAYVAPRLDRPRQRPRGRCPLSVPGVGDRLGGIGATSSRRQPTCSTRLQSTHPCGCAGMLICRGQRGALLAGPGASEP